jgi:hypothetical protein
MLIFLRWEAVRRSLNLRAATQPFFGCIIRLQDVMNRFGHETCLPTDRHEQIQFHISHFLSDRCFNSRMTNTGRLWVPAMFGGAASGYVTLLADSTGWAQGQVEGTCECGDEPSGSIKCGGNSLSSWWPVTALGRTLLHGVSWVS